MIRTLRDGSFVSSCLSFILITFNVLLETNTHWALYTHFKIILASIIFISSSQVLYHLSNTLKNDTMGGALKSFLYMHTYNFFKQLIENKIVYAGNHFEILTQGYIIYMIIIYCKIDIKTYSKRRVFPLSNKFNYPEISI